MLKILRTLSTVLLFSAKPVFAGTKYDCHLIVKLLDHAEKHTLGIKKLSPQSITADIRSGDYSRRQSISENIIRIKNAEELASIRAKYFAELANPAAEQIHNPAPHYWLATAIKYPNKTMSEMLSIYLDQRGGIEALSDVINHDPRVLTIFLSELNLEDHRRFKEILRQFRTRNTNTNNAQIFAGAIGSLGTVVGSILGFCHMNYEPPGSDYSDDIAFICSSLLDDGFQPD